MCGPNQYYQHNQLGVKPLDQFRKLMLCFIAKKLISPSKIVEQSSDALYVRYKAFNGELYNDLFGQLPEFGC